jgi:hypothetical protein
MLAITPLVDGLKLGGNRTEILTNFSITTRHPIGASICYDRLRCFLVLAETPLPDKLLAVFSVFRTYCN